MSEEAVVESVEETVATEQPAEQTQEEASAAIQAGYDRVPGIPAEAPPEPEIPMVAGMPQTEFLAKLGKIDEIDTKLNERLQKVFNNLGNLQQRLDAIPKDAPRTEVRAITADSMTKLKEMGFEDLAAALAEDLSGAFAGPAHDAPAVDVEGAFAKTYRQRAIQELDEIHPDRLEIVKSPEYSDWLGTLEQGYRNRFENSESAVFVSRGFDNFKKWRDDKTERETAAQQASEDRLKNAVPATTGKPAAKPTRLPDDAGLWAGYNKGRKPLNKR